MLFSEGGGGERTPLLLERGVKQEKSRNSVGPLRLGSQSTAPSVYNNKKTPLFLDAFLLRLASKSANVLMRTDKQLFLKNTNKKIFKIKFRILC